jgi:S-DNA-T family DNA segregation ATPase FtsK/SpoIIIE
VKEKKTRGIFKLFNFFTDDRFKLVLGLFFIVFALFLTLAFVSYFFTWKIDQSFEWSSILSSSDIKVENWSGKTGAYLAFLFMNKWFGIVSFLVPFLLIIIGFRLLNIKLLGVWKTIKVTVFAIILISVCLGYLFGDTGGYLGSGLGGSHGFLISEWLNAFIGKTGTGFLLLVSVIAFVLFSFNKSVKWIKRVVPVKQKNESRDIFHMEKGKPMSAINLGEEKDLIFETKEIKKEKEEKAGGYSTTIKEQGEDIELTIEQKSDNDDLSNGELKTRILEDYDPTLDLSTYKFPPINLLDDHQTENSVVSKEELISNKNRIVETLGNYKIQIDKIKATIGPTVTLYEIVPAPGIRISKIKNLEDDIALSLSALGIRIIAPIPGKGTIGIEVPNRKPEIVSMKSMIASKRFQESDYELTVAMGKTISNETYILDLARMPHLLVAGATGQGKSVGLNVLITSLLYKKHPSEIKFVLIDPKKVELTLYSKIERHYLAKTPGIEDAIITDIRDIINTLNSLSIEMDQRYDLLKMAHVRNAREYNEAFKNRKLNPEKGHRYLPYIIMIIDEFADLIMTAGKEIENPLARLAQLARAVGIHLVIATQRPSINIITGVIKANFPVRIAYRVISMIDSRTILDSPGANQLVGRGDMLISPGSDLIRVQCAYVSTAEIDKITDFIGSQKGYPTAYMLPEYSDETFGDMSDIDPQKRDPLFDEAAHIVVLHQQGSTSLIQRKLSIGYNRAGRIIDQLEAAGIVGPFEGSKARQVLIPDEYSLEQYLSKLNKEEPPL